MADRTRIRYFDALKLFAMFSVLMVHSIGALSEYGNEKIFCLIGTYHMPLFMTISGFFGAHIVSQPFISVLSKKFRTLLLPAICLGIIPMLLLGCDPCSTLKSSFWFLRSAFVCAILFYIANKYKKFAIPVFIMAVTVWIWAIWWLYPCYIAGAFIYKYYDRFIKNRGKIVLISLLVYFFMLAIGDSRFYDHEGFIVLPARYSDVSLIQYIYIMAYIRCYRIITGLAASIFFISLFGWLAEYFPKTESGDIICRYGQYTLGIYILQTFVLELYIATHFNFSEMNYYIFHFILAPYVSIAVLFICIGIIHVIHYSKFMSFILLGEQPPFTKKTK